MVRASLGQGRVFSAVEILKDAKGGIVEFEDVSDEIGAVRTLFLSKEASYNHARGTQDFKHVRAESYHLDMRLERECGRSPRRRVVYVATIAVREGNSRFLFPARQLERQKRR